MPIAIPLPSAASATGLSGVGTAASAASAALSLPLALTLGSFIGSFRPPRGGGVSPYRRNPGERIVEHTDAIPAAAVATQIVPRFVTVANHVYGQPAEKSKNKKKKGKNQAPQAPASPSTGTTTAPTPAPTPAPQPTPPAQPAPQPTPPAQPAPSPAPAAQPAQPAASSSTAAPASPGPEDKKPKRKFTNFDFKGRFNNWKAGYQNGTYLGNAGRVLRDYHYLMGGIDAAGNIIGLGQAMFDPELEWDPGVKAFEYTLLSPLAKKLGSNYTRRIAVPGDSLPPAQATPPAVVTTDTVPSVSKDAIVNDTPTSAQTDWDKIAREWESKP